MDFLKTLIEDSNCSKEVRTSFNLDLILNEIIRSGNANDSFQILTLSFLSEFFKDNQHGQSIRSMNFPGNYATSETNISHIKSLSDQEKVHLAQYLLDCIKAGECALSDKSLSTVDWINFVLQRDK